MSLIPCTDCGNQVSRSARACPACGCPYDGSSIFRVIVGLLREAPRPIWLGESVVGLLMLVTLVTAPRLWPLLMLLLVAGVIHVFRKSSGLVQPRYPGKHRARQTWQAPRPLTSLGLTRPHPGPGAATRQPMPSTALATQQMSRRAGRLATPPAVRQS